MAGTAMSHAKDLLTILRLTERQKSSLEKIPLLCAYYLGAIREGEADASRIPAIRYAGHR
jgi:hypothetical protein